VSVKRILIAFGVLTASAVAEPMRFAWHIPCGGSGCDYYALAEGDITEETPAEFRSFLSRPVDPEDPKGPGISDLLPSGRMRTNCRPFGMRACRSTSRDCP
jgi:hypothetical protein